MSDKNSAVKSSEPTAKTNVAQPAEPVKTEAADTTDATKSAGKSASSPKPIKPLRPIISTKKRKTYLRMLRSIICAAIVVIVILIVLQLFGINVSSMLAGVGIASIIIGFALQDAMKDIFRGLEIVSDNYYDIGDVIKYNDTVGQVLSINLRTTKVQDINSMNIVSIANRNIDQVEIVTGYIYISAPLPLRIKPTAAEMVMNEIVEEIKKIPTVTSVVSQGLTAITNSSLNYQLQITSDPINELQTRRDSLGCIVSVLASHKILLPYNQLELHSKK